MGRSFGNLHAFVGDANHAPPAKTLAAAVTRWVTAGPFREISPVDSLHAHRTFAILDSGRWLSVYCTEAATGEGEALARQLAGDTGLPVLWCRLLDSSFLELRVYDVGGESDCALAVLDPPDASVPISRLPEPDGAVWHGLLREGATCDDLLAHWRAPLESAEEKLAAVSTLIGLDPSRTSSSVPSAGHGDRVTNLRFTATDDAPWLVDPGLPSRLCPVYNHVFRVHGSVAGGLRPSLVAWLVSCGGESRGIDIELGGSPLAQRKLDNLRVRVGVGQPDVGHEFVVETQPDELGVARTRVRDVAIPRGAADVAALAQDAATRASAHDVLNALSVRLVLESDVLAPGDGEIVMRVVPEESPKDGVVLTVPLSLS